MTARILLPDGTETATTPANGKTFELEELQKIVGGYIEILALPGKPGEIMVCNEEGKLEGLPINPAATQLWKATAQPGSPRMFDDVVGTVLLCHTTQIE